MFMVITAAPNTTKKTARALFAKQQPEAGMSNANTNEFISKAIGEAKWDNLNRTAIKPKPHSEELRTTVEQMQGLDVAAGTKDRQYDLFLKLDNCAHRRQGVLPSY
eukprot:SAG31_NODE_1652_length_7628_cov_100.866118_3_plen_106_part_00